MQDFCSLRSLMTDIQKAEESFSKTLGLTLAQASMMCAVSHGFGNLKDLQEKLELTPSRVTRLADSLEKKGLVRRMQAGDDRRVVMLELSGSGKKMMEKAGSCEVRLPKDIEALLASRAKEKTWQKHM